MELAPAGSVMEPNLSIQELSGYKMATILYKKKLFFRFASKKKKIFDNFDFQNIFV